MPPVPESSAEPADTAAPTRLPWTRPVPEGSAAPAEGAVANDYDSFAEAYTAETEANLINGYYMRPAILDLAGAWPAGGSSTPAAAPAPFPRRCATGAPS
jgi:hypothetical protein